MPTALAVQTSGLPLPDCAQPPDGDDEDERLCSAPDCDRPVHSRGFYCAAHAKRKERGNKTKKPVRERMTLRERVGKLCDDLAKADSENDAAYERVWDALEHALRDWEKQMRQRRAGKARWNGMSAAQRREAMRAAVRVRWNTSQASISTPPRKGKRRARGKG